MNNNKVKTIKISTMGQIALPRELMKMWGISKGSEVVIFYNENYFMISKKAICKYNDMEDSYCDEFYEDKLKKMRERDLFTIKKIEKGGDKDLAEKFVNFLKKDYDEFKKQWLNKETVVK